MTHASLTRKQQEILAFAAIGLSSIEIGQRINRSPKTVRNQLSTIYQKIGVENRVQAATKFLEWQRSGQLPIQINAQ